MPGGLELDPPILDPGPLAVRGQVQIDSGTNIARVVGMTPGAFAPVTGPVFFGLNVTGPAVPFFMTSTQSTAILNVFTSALKGLAPASGGGTTNFLRADGTWAVPPGSGGSAGWDDVLAIDAHSGANNPIIDNGQHLRFGTSAPTQVTGDIRSDAGLFIHPDTSFEVQAHDTIHIHGPDSVLIESTGGSPVKLASSVTVEMESTAGPVVLDANTFVDVTNGFVRFQEAAASTPSMVAGKALFWVRNDVPNRPMFTDDTDVDARIALLPIALTEIQTINTARILGRVTAGTGAVEQLTGTQATTLLDNFTSALKGLAPASGGGTTNFLRADGTWAVPIDLGHIIRVDSTNQTQRAGLNFIDTGDILVTPTDDSVANETELRFTFAPVATNTFAANATAGSAAYTPIALSAESIPARTSGNISQLTSAAQSILLRSSGSLSFVTAAADQVLRRSASGDLGFGTLVTNNLGNDIVTFGKMQNIVSDVFLGRITATAGDIETLTMAQATSMLDVFTSTLQGLAPASGGGTTNFLRADGTWAAPTAGTAGHTIRDNGVAETQRGALNFLSSTTITSVCNDDSVSNETEVVHSVNLAATYAWSGAHDFGSTADFSNQVKLTGVFANTLAATTNNLAIGNANAVILTLTGSQTLTGMIPAADGQMVWLENTDSVDILTLDHDSASSTTTNRFFLPLSEDYSLLARTGAWFRYNATLGRWILADSKQFTGLSVREGAIVTSGVRTIGLVDTTSIAMVKTAPGASDNIDLSANLVVAHMAELSSSPAVGAGSGMFWVRNLAPSSAVFTDDLENDWPLNNTVVANNTAVTSVTNSTADVTGASVTVPANSLRVGTIYKVEGFITVSRGATATACIATVELVLGGTIYSTVNTNIFLDTNATGYIQVTGYILCTAIGATGTFIANMATPNNTAAIAGATPTATEAYDLVGGDINTAVSATTKDTTASQTLTVRASMTAAVSALTLRWTHAIITRMN